MQTFLPYSDFKESAQCLDRLRLGKQRVEALQISKTLRGLSKGWINHPAVRMWEGHLDSLHKYLNCMIEEWIDRGYRNTIIVPKFNHKSPNPEWLGYERFHTSHRSNLLRKFPEHYRQFNWKEPYNLPYFWPRR